MTTAPLPRPAELLLDPLSTASLRVLCALRYKGIELPLRTVRLREGAHQAEAHRALNPSQAVPVLLLEGGEPIAQSVAILEYLDACYPEPRLVPTDALEAARVRSVALMVAADLHPLINWGVRNEVAQEYGDAARQAWLQRWSARGCAALEGWLARHAGHHAVGDVPTLADFVIAPTVNGLIRLGCAPAEDSRIAAVYRYALELPAFEPLRTLTAPAAR